MKWPSATFWRCNACRWGLTTSDTFRFACRYCGSRYLVPVSQLTWRDRLRMIAQGYWPWTRHVLDD